jgi:flagellar hook-basal body complex protein FliE
MRVEPLVPDAPAMPDNGDTAGFGHALDWLAGALAGATRAEDDFAYGKATLQSAVYERAQADVALSVATATAQRIAQSVQSVLNMQV